MKIAVVSDDGVTISQHFGRAPFYVVFTVEGGRVTGREVREKAGHAHFAGEHHHGHEHGAGPHGHGFGPAAERRHARMMEAIADCEVLLAGGMGARAYESLRRTGIRPILTDFTRIDDAVQAYLEGRLKDHPERLH